MRWSSQRRTTWRTWVWSWRWVFGLVRHLLACWVEIKDNIVCPCVSGFHVQVGGPRYSRGHARERQDCLRQHPADLRLAPRVRPAHVNNNAYFCPPPNAVPLTVCFLSASSWWSWSVVCRIMTCWRTFSSDTWVISHVLLKLSSHRQPQLALAKTKGSCRFFSATGFFSLRWTDIS